MEELEIYSQEWKIFLPQYLEYGIREKDLEFSMEWEEIPQKSAILLSFSKKVYQTIKRTAEMVGDGFDKIIRDIEVVDVPPRSNLVILSVPNRNQLFMIQAIIALSFPLLKEEKTKKERSKKRDRRKTKR